LININPKKNQTYQYTVNCEFFGVTYILIYSNKNVMTPQLNYQTKCNE